MPFRKENILVYRLIILQIALLIVCSTTYADDYEYLDSLMELTAKTEGTPRQVDLYNEIAQFYFSQDNLITKDSTIIYSLNAIEASQKIDYKEGAAEAQYVLGKYYLGVSNKPADATRHFLKGLDLYTKLDDKKGISKSYMQLGLISYVLQYYEGAVEKLLHSLEFSNDPTSRYLLAITYSELDSSDLAKEYFFKSITDFKGLEDPHRLNECYMWLGRLHLKTGQLDSAFFYLNRTIEYGNNQNSTSLLVRPFAFVAEAYFKTNNYDKAIFYAERSFELENAKTADEQSDNISLIQAANILSKVYVLKKDYKKAYYYLNEYNIASHEYTEGSTLQKVADMQSMFEFDQEMNLQKVRQQKDKEIAAQQISNEKDLRNAFIVGFVLLLLLLIVLYNRFNIRKKANAELNELNKVITLEKKRSDDLLLNILPEEVAEELKEKGHTEAQLIEKVTVLFTDFKGFTDLAEKLSAKELVNDLNVCFSEFDSIMQKYQIEKIKTIGDSYMAASGLPIPKDKHTNMMIHAALDIRDFIEEAKAKKIEEGLPYFELRIGLNTGPVVAGIVGVKKFQYDIWGDTVNTASKMESSGEVGKVNISQATYDLLKDDPELLFENRGKIKAKGKGEMKMYFVERKGNLST